MKLSAKSLLKILLPLSFGLVVVYLFFSKLSPENKTEIRNAFAEANYFWLIASGIVATVGQAFRTLRWRMLLKSMGYEIPFFKAFNAISVNYLVNLGIPRAGEFARCGVLARYDNIPIQKSIGTLVNERVLDLIMLGLTGVLAMILEYQLFVDFSKSYILPSLQGVFGKLINVFLIVLMLAAFSGILYLLYKKGKLSFIDKIKHILDDLAAGMLSIRYMENPGRFILLTIANWSMYWFMIYLAFLTIPVGATLPFLAALMILFFGTFGFIAVQGGLGVYPIIVGLVLGLYGIPNHMGNTIGWLMWIGQTVFIFITALFALPFFMRYKKAAVK